MERARRDRAGGQAGDEQRSKRLNLVGEYYDGPSYGQFFRDEVRYYGFGIHVGI